MVPINICISKTYWRTDSARARSTKSNSCKFHICINNQKYAKLHGARSIDTPFNNRYALGTFIYMGVCLLNTLCIQMHILLSYNSMDSSTIYYDITDPRTAQLRICQPSTSRWWFRNVSTHLKKSPKGNLLQNSGEQTTLQHVARHANGEKMRYQKKNKKKNSTSNSNQKTIPSSFLGSILVKELSCSSRDISSSTLWRSSH